MIRTINRMRSSIIARLYDINIVCLKWLRSPLFQAIVQSQLERNQFGKELHLELRQRYEDKIFVDTRIYRDLIRATVRMFLECDQQKIADLAHEPEEFYKELKLILKEYTFNTTLV